VFIRYANSVTIDSSSFNSNTGFYQTKGIAILVSLTTSLSVTGSEFNNNLGGMRGSAIYLSRVSNVSL
jgi:hypothetical protein